MSSANVTIPRARTFAGSPEEIRSVRQFVGEQIRNCPAADDVILLASELATNAIRHTASGKNDTFCVLVQAVHGVVRVEVHDLGSDTTPVVRRSGSPGEAGAGLGLVEAIATRWGFHGSQFGRVVWFEVGWLNGPSLRD
jgi:anti-sigma regulatory factor (Ser/Thr protein kinase)